MCFNTLPPEIVELIVIHCLPEGFESLALTCKAIYALCTRFIEHHNTLRRHFQTVTYHHKNEEIKDPKWWGRPNILRRPYGPSSAYMLILEIAREPVIARYVQVGNLSRDTRASRGWPWHTIWDDHPGEAVAGLLARSWYLKQAGIDWKEYYAVINEDIETGSFSQYAAAFVLTLLPNLVELHLPMWWKPTDVTDKLLDVIIERAGQTGPSCNSPSLAQVTIIDASYHLETGLRLLALPNVQEFRGWWCEGEARIVSRYLKDSFASKLECISLRNAYVDAESMAYLLKRTPRLRKLVYEHTTPKERGPENWDPCRLISVIKHEVGAHLEELRFEIGNVKGSVLPGELSFRGFQKLVHLGFSLKIAMCMTKTSQGISANYDLSLCSILPASVSEVFLYARDMKHDADFIEFLFRDLETKKPSHLPNLQKIRLDVPDKFDTAFRDRCRKLANETAKQGVHLYSRTYGFFPGVPPVEYVQIRENGVLTLYELE